MGRRSQHNRDQLEAMMIAAGRDVMRERGFAGFSAREVARRVGYSVGTIYNVFPSLDHLLAAINTATFDDWADHLRLLLARNPDDRIRALVEGYFSFARNNRNLWMAIYDHRFPPEMAIPEADAARRAGLTSIVIEEVARALDTAASPPIARLARSLIATVHGHCVFDLNGTFELMGEADPAGMALGRVREVLSRA
jgi:AcrR family transcriptional regulator